MKIFKRNKRGVVAIYVTGFIVMLIITMLGAVFAPMGVLFNSEMYVAGEDILSMANDSINRISDNAVRNSVQGSLNSAFASGANNIEINANIYQYSWVFVVALSGIIIFLLARRIIEVQQGGLRPFV